MVHPAYVYEASLSPQEQVPITSVPVHPTARSHADSVELDFERVYADNFDFIWRAARSLGIPAESAEDVTHDIFLVVHRKLSSLQDPSALRSWLFGIARRVCKDYRRALGRRGTQLELDAQREIDHRQDPQNAALSRQALQVVERYAEGLDEERRALFFLALLEGLPVAEVASTLELNANTTYSRVRVMRRELAELLDAETSDMKGNDGSA
ncbi:MAG TPA: RNA polymerase sigma factor [Polyangiaceae bacterium]|nr:RNA polymerase sigma factor [Polyangiaceae bacterium]